MQIRGFEDEDVRLETLAALSVSVSLNLCRVYVITKHISKSIKWCNTPIGSMREIKQQLFFNPSVTNEWLFTEISNALSQHVTSGSCSLHWVCLFSSYLT